MHNLISRSKSYTGEPFVIVIILIARIWLLQETQKNQWHKQVYIPQKSSPHTAVCTLHSHWSCSVVALLGWSLSWHLWKSFFCCLSWLPTPPLNICDKRSPKLILLFSCRIFPKKPPRPRYQTYSRSVFTTFDREGPLSESISKMQGLWQNTIFKYTVF